ncbi:calcium-binding protein [Leisingera sp. HS039]|uniref:calcium-binding protein n=1 Tax=unclassified Leisingera TaxID=2614906 RepID=UPI001070F9C0|nr:MULTISPECIES: calcium-binding protein [unclassified Leisingera]MBQ4823681.1 calcium-binding protein [Leisingera sp. HS039]QBR35953.1 calcium-binding protein [Leisingera sp. NJS201]
MTTFTFSGLRVDYENGDAVAAKEIDASIIVSSASSAFSYSITGHDEDGVAIINVADDIQQIIADGTNLDAPNFPVVSEETQITRVTWSGGTSTVLILAFETGGNSDTEFYFVIDGPQIPDVSTLSDWTAFNASISDLSDPTGAFGPGQNIPWSSIDGATRSQDDEFWGTPGRNIFNGGKGDDYFSSSDGRDTYNGGAGSFDQVSFTGDPNGVTAHLGTGKATDGWGRTDTLKSIEVLRGSAFDDSLSGSGKNNTFRGVEGNDTIKGGKGRDEVRYDRDERYGGEDGATVNLSKGFAIDGFGDRDTLKSIENARGSDSGDKITGSSTGNRIMGLAGNDTLSGKGGSDTIFGGGGKDRINGDGGNDLLSGEGGADRFIFKGTFGDDTVSDFSTAGRKEKIDLSDVATIKHFRDLKNNHLSENDDGDAVIRDNRGNTITLEDIAVADLSGNDFLF